MKQSHQNNPFRINRDAKPCFNQQLSEGQGLRQLDKHLLERPRPPSPESDPANAV
jgi:hypothetical protein